MVVDSSVIKVAGYALDGRGSFTGRGKDLFIHLHVRNGSGVRPVSFLFLTTFLGVIRPEDDAHDSPMKGHGVVLTHRYNFTFVTFNL
jgi:hypothetical protein